MFQSIHGWIQANPLITAWALCYLLTFVAVRQVKPFLPHFELKVTWLPEDFRKRLILRFCVFCCGSVVSLVVLFGLVVFDCCALTWAKVIYIAVSVGFLAPFFYDLIFFTLRVLEFLKILNAGTVRKISQLIDPKPSNA
jgi:hypothetical protein